MDRLPGLGCRADRDIVTLLVIAALRWEHLRAKSADGSAGAAEVIAHLIVSARQDDVFDGAFSRDDYGVGPVSAPQG